MKLSAKLPKSLKVADGMKGKEERDRKIEGGGRFLFTFLIMCTTRSANEMLVTGVVKYSAPLSLLAAWKVDVVLSLPDTIEARPVLTLSASEQSSVLIQPML